jgi:hypothetical protein
MKFFLAKICSKKYINEQKSQATENPEVLVAFTHTKKLIWGHPLGPGSATLIFNAVLIFIRRDGGEELSHECFLSPLWRGVALPNIGIPRMQRRI